MFKFSFCCLAFTTLIFAQGQSSYVINGNNGGMAGPTGPTGPSYVTQMESFGVAAGATASNNVTNGNLALAVKGIVTLNTCGTYMINAPWLITGDTRLILADCVHIQQAASTNGNLLINNGYKTFSTTTSVTIGSPTGTVLPVTWTAHGLIVGQFVLLSGSSPSNYNGVFRVASVTDANTFSVILDRFTSVAATGTAVGKLCERNITVEGGLWDYNQANNPSTGLSANTMIFGCVQNLNIHNIVAENGQKFLINLGAVRDYNIDGVNAVITGSDIIKVYGPAYNGKISRIYGQAGDDGISLSPKEAAAFSTFMWTFGDVMLCSIDGVDIEDVTGAGNQVVMYASANEYFGGITVKNIGGTNAVSGGLLIQGLYASSVMQDVTYENITSNAITPFAVTGYGPASGSVTIQNITMKHLTMNPPSLTQQPLMFVLTGNTVKSLTIEDVAFNNALYSSTGVNYVFAFNGIVNEVNFDNWNFTNSSTNLRAISVTNTATLGKVNITRFFQPVAAANFVVINASVTTAGFWSIRDSTFNTTAIFNTSSSVNVDIWNSTFTAATQGVLRDAGTITINGSWGGNFYSGGSLRQVSTSGTPVLNLKDYDPLNGSIDFGSFPTISGCGTTATQTGGTTIGTFAVPVGTTSCAPVITLPTSTGVAAKWKCNLTDLTTSTALFTQASTLATSCTMNTTTVVAGDVIQFSAQPY